MENTAKLELNEMTNKQLIIEFKLIQKAVKNNNLMETISKNDKVDLDDLATIEYLEEIKAEIKKRNL